MYNGKILVCRERWQLKLIGSRLEAEDGLEAEAFASTHEFNLR